MSTAAKYQDGPLDARKVISFHHVDLQYRDQKALADVHFSVDNGEFLCITGPSGAGKSSILRLIAMDAFPTRGEVMVRGMLASKMNRRSVPRLRREIGFVFQDFRLLADRNVEDNVAFAQLVVGVPRAHIVKNVMRVLTQVGLYAKRHRRVHELSGGEQQLLAVARAGLARADPPIRSVLSQRLEGLRGLRGVLGHHHRAVRPGAGPCRRNARRVTRRGRC